MSYHLNPEERKNLVDKLIKEGKPIGQISKDSGISRPTIYKWLKDYNYANQEGKDFNFETKKKNITFYHNQATPEQEKLVLQEIRRNPLASKYEISSNLKSQFPKKALGPTGVYKVLLRNGLNLAYDREKYAYNDIRKSEELTNPWVGGLQGFLKTSSISFVFTFFIALGIIAWINLITGDSPLQGGVGYIFSGLALSMGTVFFLYSLKYYLTLALVLSFSQEGKGEGEIRIETKGRSLLSWLLGLGGRKVNDRKAATLTKAGGLEPNLEHVVLTRHPFVSIHIPLYNERNVVSRVLKASTSFEYGGEYEVIICDDSTDETSKIIYDYLGKFQIPNSKFQIQRGEGWTLSSAEVVPGVILKHLHRTSRQGFKGGALRLALSVCDPRAEFISVFDADFVPYPDTLELFLKYFQVTAGTLDFRKGSGVWGLGSREKPSKPYTPIPNPFPIAAVQGYQWHVLNKSENWITRGVRSEYAGSYVIERSGVEIYGGLKQISGSVYMIRKDVLEEIGWETSITEDFELTLKLYEKGYKVVYTPYIQAPAECVATLKGLVRQRMRWAEGHSNNVRRMFTRLMFGHWEEKEDTTVEGGGWKVDADEGRGSMVENPPSIFNPQPLSSTLHSPSSKVFVPSPLTLSEKLEFLYLSPYYLQAFFFLIGTLSWLISETLFRAHLPFWTELWGWSLVLTNLLALPLMNAVGLFLEESEEKDYAGIASFVALSYILVPFQAYASLKGFLERTEGPWFRTPKTGRITDIFTRGRFFRFIQGILPRQKSFGQLGGQAGRAPAVQALGARHWGLGFSLNPNPYTLNPSFSIRPRRIKWASKATLAVLLVVVVFLNNLSFFANTTNAQAADPAIEQQINIIDQEYSTTSTSSAPTDNSLGYIYWDSAKYSGTRTINLDIVGRTSATSAQMIAALYDDSGGIVSQSKATIGNANKIAHLDGCPECDSAGSMIYTHGLILDSFGYPYISYIDNTARDLKLIHCGNVNCTSGNVITTIDGCSGCDLNGDIEKHSSIRLNSSGNPVISYYDSTNTALKLVVCANPNCTSRTHTTVDNGGTDDVGSYSHMRLNSGSRLDYPVITYFDATNDDLEFAYCNNANCTSPTLRTLDGCTGCNSNSSAGQYSSFELDTASSTCTSGTKECPVIAYRSGASDHSLKLLHCTVNDCASGNYNVVDDGTLLDSAGVYNSLKLDSNGYPVISFGRGRFGLNLDLKFAHCNDVNCDPNVNGAETVNILDGQGSGANCASATGSDCDSGDVGWYNKIQLDTTSSACTSSPKECPIISYRSQVAGDLKLIHCNDNDCSGNNESVVRVDGCTGCSVDGNSISTGAGGYTGLVLDSSGYPVVSYRTVGDSEDLMVVHCVNYDCNPTGSGQVDPTNNQRAESMVFTPNLTGGATTRNLTVRVWVTSGTGYIKAARLRIIQNDATNITDTQTQVEIGNAQNNFSNTTYSTLTDHKIYLFDTNKFSGTKTIYFEATLHTDTSTNTVSAQLLQCTSASDCSTGSAVSGSERTHTGDTNWTRKRTTSGITLTDDANYAVQVKMSAGTGDIANAKVIIEQTDASGLTDIEMVHQYVNTKKSLAQTGTTAYARLAIAGGAAVSGSTVSTTNTSYTRARSSGISPSTNTYDTEISLDNTTYTQQDFDNRYNSANWVGGTFTYLFEGTLRTPSANNEDVSSSWLIIQVSGLQVPENLLPFLPLVLFLPMVVKWFRVKNPKFSFEPHQLT